MNTKPVSVFRLQPFAALLAAVMVLFNVRHAAAQTVNIPDANLLAVVRSTLNIPTGPITEADMLNLTNLFAGGQNIADTTGLQYASNLTVLALDNDPVTNFAGFSGLGGLTQLQFTFASLPNISFATNLPHLQHAFLAGNHLTNAGPLAGLTNLLNLSINFNRLTNAAPLAWLVHLTNLDLGDNQVTNCSAVSNLAALQFLSLSGNPTPDVSPDLVPDSVGSPARSADRYPSPAPKYWMATTFPAAAAVPQSTPPRTPSSP